MNDNLFEIKNLNVYSKGNKIVDNLNFKIKKNTILGIVGESGSGKSITALSILKLSGFRGLKQSGDIYFSNSNLKKFSGNNYKNFLKNECF